MKFGLSALFVRIKGMARRSGTEMEAVKAQAVVMHEEGYSFRAIKEKLRCSSDTVYAALKEKDGVDIAKRDTFKSMRANMLRNKADYILDKISDDDIERASLKDKVISIGILNQRAVEIEAGTTGATHNHLHLSGLMDKIGSTLNVDKVKDVIDVKE